MQRYKFGARTKSNQGQVAPADIFEQTNAFAEKVRFKAKEIGVSVIWNVDQTTVNFEMLPRKTIDDKGVRTVWVCCTVKEKERVSVMLLANSDGAKKKPCIVMKQLNPTTAEALTQNKVSRNGFSPTVWKYKYC